MFDNPIDGRCLACEALDKASEHRCAPDRSSSPYLQFRRAGESEQKVARELLEVVGGGQRAGAGWGHKDQGVKVFRILMPVATSVFADKVQAQQVISTSSAMRSKRWKPKSPDGSS